MSLELPVDYATYSNDNLTVIPIPKPANVVAGDLLIAIVYVGSGDLDFTAPAGWTALELTATTPFTVKTFYKAAGGSEPSSYDFTQSVDGSNRTMAGLIVRIVGGQIIDASSKKDNTASTNGAATALSTTNADCLLLYFIVHSAASASTYAIATNNPVSWGELYDTNVGAGTLSIGYALRPATGDTGAGSALLASSVVNRVILVAVKPAPTFTNTDVLALVSSFQGNMTAVITETLGLVDTITSAIKMVVHNVAKNVEDWLNQDKS